jgi:hypothetical protein
MRRSMLNRLASLVILGGGLFLVSAPASATTCDGPAGAGGCTCSGGGYTCTGDSCTSNSSGCTATDKPVKQQEFEM